MQVRRIRPDDGPVLQAVRLRALQDAPEAFARRYDQAAAMDAAYWQEQARRQSTSDERTTFFLVRHGSVQGMIGAFFENGDRHCAFVCAMWVAPEHRRSGAGAHLADTAARWLVERGAPQVLAWVAENSTPALRFYETLGFLPTGAKGSMPGRPEQAETLLALDAAMLCELKDRHAA